MPFSFLNSAFLAGLVAAAVPILIHLFSRRKSKRLPFSSLQFIEEIAKRRVRRVKITQWLILALRVLVIALVVLALGRPALKGDFALGKSRGESAVALILDRSFSMRAATDKGLLFDEAKARALDMTNALEDGDEIHFLGVTPGLETAAPPFHDRLRLKEELQTVEPGWGGTDFVEAIREAGARLRQAEALNKELVIVSDFQRSGFGEFAESPGTHLSDLIGKDTRVYLVPVGDGPIDNASVENVSVEGITPDRTARVLVANHSGKPLESLPVTVSIGGQAVGEGRVSIESQSSNTAVVPIVAGQTDSPWGDVRIGADRLAADDVRYFAAEGGRAFRILVVDGARPGEDRSPFLPLALSPGAGVGQFNTDVETASNLGAVDLAPYQVVVLSNVERINLETVGRLKSWQDAGGRIVMVLGDRVDLRFYNEDLLPALLPGTRFIDLKGDPRNASTFFSLTPRVSGHPAFVGFRATPGEPISGAEFWRIVLADPGPNGRVLAEFGPNIPAIIEQDGGALFTSSLDGKWNNFPTQGAFLPLFHQMIFHLAGRETQGGALVGQPLEHVVEESAVPTGAVLRAEGPEKVVLSVTARQSNQGLLLTSDPAPAPGIYRIKAGDNEITRLPVNVDTRESELNPLSDAELKSLFPGRQVRVLKPDDTVENMVREARYGREYWREFLIAALALLGFEAFLARKGGTA